MFLCYTKEYNMYFLYVVIWLTLILLSLYYNMKNLVIDTHTISYGLIINVPDPPRPIYYHTFQFIMARYTKRTHVTNLYPYLPHTLHAYINSKSIASSYFMYKNLWYRIFYFGLIYFQVKLLRHYVIFTKSIRYRIYGIRKHWF